MTSFQFNIARYSRLSRLLTAVLAMLLAAPILAQDAASLEAAVRDFYDKLNDEDPSFADYYLPEADSFPRTGLILGPFPDSVTARENIESGLDFEVELHHLDTRIFEDTGIATYYTTGTTTYPDGVILTGTHRATLVTVWQGGRWRIVHGHLSELKTLPE
ncbi:MAG TPA: nuclear transport factor 2 family protein [Rhodothermales bacterium]|nr:nuclear transport factor 2 family protein [Rhodothermales bacterium]